MMVIHLACGARARDEPTLGRLTVRARVMSLAVCAGVSLVAAILVGRVVAYRTRVTHAKREFISLASRDEENQRRVYTPPLSEFILLFLRHQTRVVVIASVVLFFFVAFVHEWVQESLQLRGEITRLVAIGPPKACFTTTEVATPILHIDRLFQLLSLGKSSARARALSREECKEYEDRINRIWIANPLTALIQLLTSVFVHPWSQVSSSAGFAFSQFVEYQSFRVQLLVFASLVIVTVALANTCLIAACSPHGVCGQCVVFLLFGRVGAVGAVTARETRVGRRRGAGTRPAITEEDHDHDHDA
jgi:hypothetical protein